MTFLEKYDEPAYALLRVVGGLLFLGHGVMKYFSFPEVFPYPLDAMRLTAGAIEIVAGVMIVVGFYTRPAAFIASGMSAVGYWTMHGNTGAFPITNGGETIVLYCFLFLLVATRGAGIWSIDQSRSK